MFMGTVGPLYFWAFQHTSHHPHVLNVYFGVFWYVLFHVYDGSIGEEATGRNDVISKLHYVTTAVSLEPLVAGVISCLCVN